MTKTTTQRQPYVQIKDKYGAVASIFDAPDDKHRVIYADNQGRTFYTECFDHISIEMVEQSVMDWASGKREFL